VQLGIEDTDKTYPVPDRAGGQRNRNGIPLYGTFEIRTGDLCTLLILQVTVE
jgi:hypothetical protein